MILLMVSKGIKIIE